jgi:cytochrome c-type biogenesis protein CcmH
MIMVFVLVAGTLAAGAAVLLVLPLLRAQPDARPASSIAAGVVLFVLLLGGAGLYAALSNFTWVDEPVGPETPAAMTAKLAKRLAQEPDNLEGWLMLGRSYTALEQFPLAARAYQRADRLANGQNTEAVIGLGETLVAQDPEALSGAAGHLFERALAIEPQNGKALFYSAFAALARGDLAPARERFTRMLALNPPPEVRDIIEKRIAGIDQSLDASQLAATESKSSGLNDGATISVRVSLAPALAGKIAADAPLFVAARDPKQPGPPFAVKRLAARFPIDVELTAGDAMLESRRIASGQELEVVARIALGGSPTATRGDPFGQVRYHVGKDGRLNIVIDQLSP